MSSKLKQFCFALASTASRALESKRARQAKNTLTARLSAKTLGRAGIGAVLLGASICLTFPAISQKLAFGSVAAFFGSKAVPYKVLRPDSVKEYFIEDLIFLRWESPDTLAVMRHTPKPDVWRLKISHVWESSGYLILEGKRGTETVRFSLRKEKLMISVSGSEPPVFSYEFAREASPAEVDRFHEDPLFVPFKGFGHINSL
jgi:hypothetical protein